MTGLWAYSNRYPCDNGYKEVTAIPPRDIVYDQDIQLIGLRDKPITQQDTLSRSVSPPRFLPRQDPLSLFEASPLSSCLDRTSKHLENPQGPIFDFNPEIERPQRNLKRRIRRLMEGNRNNGQHPADGQGLPAQADGAIASPIPQNNQQPPVRTVCDYLSEDLEGLNPAVTMLEFEAEHFELKPVMFNMLNTLG
ncbi:hypothetical protein V6N13_130140 [Hibiscus sabdariffa]